MDRFKSSHIFWLALLVGLIVRLIIIFQPEASLLTRWGSDDLYYYSQIAGNVVSGNGFSFDGIHMTNGFQPLFMGLLIPFGKMLLNDVHTSWIVVSSIVTALTIFAAFQMKRLAEEAGWGKWIAVLLPSLFLVHPKIISVTFNGTEAALSFLMLVLVLRAFIWIGEARRIFLSALVFGLFAITRMEFSLFLLMLFLFGVSQRHSIKNWIMAAIGPVLTVSTWLAINYIYFGNIMPSSGQAKSIHADAIPFSFLDSLKGTVGTVLYAESAISFTVIFLLLAGSVWMLRGGNKNLVKWVLFLTISGALLITPALIQMHGFRDWYLVPQYFLLLLFLSVGLELVLMNSKKWAWTLIAVPILLWGEAEWHPRKMSGDSIFMASKQIHMSVPDNVRIGSFNAGIPGTYLGNDYVVVNLDGVVNNSVLPFQRNKTLEVYLEREGIEYIFDVAGSIEFFLKQFGSNVNWKVIKEFHNGKDRWQLIQILPANL